MTKVDATFQYASVPEAARLIGITRARVRQLLLTGGLHGHKVGANWAIPALEIERFRQIPKTVGRPRSGERPKNHN
jgi:excisionase family DNA binding protein